MEVQKDSSSTTETVEQGQQDQQNVSEETKAELIQEIKVAIGKVQV